MDRPDHHHHHFFMPPPPPTTTTMQQQQQQLCSSVPMMDHHDHHQTSSSPFLARRKRRFTEEQIRSLESTFHAHHAKLEPREKAELARELGLQPRQVAIWFQNKRARWRSKQLEHDYAALKAKYDALHARVEALKHENLAITAQLRELREREHRRRHSDGAAAEASSSSCNLGGDADVDEEDNKKNVLAGCVDMEPPESCVLGGACATPADVSVDSDCDDHHVVDDYDGGFPDSFCAATPELWEPWPLLEWNAVA